MSATAPSTESGIPGAAEPAVWMYWEDRPGTTKPPYLELCLETVERHRGAMPLRLIGRDSAAEWLPGLREEWGRLPRIAHRADYLRPRLLHRYGGIWLDSDVIVFADLGEVLRPLASFDFAGYGLDRDVVETGLLAARPGSPLMSAWATEQDRLLDRAGDLGEIGWTSLAHDILAGLVPRHQCYSFPVGRIAPVPWQDWRRFFSEAERLQPWLRSCPLTIMLYNEVMRGELEWMTREDLLASPTLLGDLLRAGLAIPGGERRSWRHLYLRPASLVYWSPAGRLARRATAYGRWQSKQLVRRLGRKVRP